MTNTKPMSPGKKNISPTVTSAVFVGPKGADMETAGQKSPVIFTIL